MSRGFTSICGVKRPHTSSSIPGPTNKKVVLSGDLMCQVAVPAKEDQRTGAAATQDTTIDKRASKACIELEPRRLKKALAKRTNESRKRNFFAKYDQGELIGVGSFGQVFKGLRREDQLPVAIKYMPIRCIKRVKIGDDKYKSAEVYYHKKADHPNIIKLLAHHAFDGQHVLVLERPAKCIDLFDYLAEPNNILCEKESKEVFRQLLSAVQHLDGKNILHHDLKSENILLDLSDGKKTVKVIDFGLAGAAKQEPITNFFGTKEFCPPEYHTLHQYDGRQATVWSLGCILYDMLTSDIPFKGAQDAATKPLKMPENIAKDGRSFLSMMLEKQADRRASLKDLACHPWLSKN